MRKTNFAVGEYYHIYNRGTDKRKIFTTKKEYERFTALLYLANDTQPLHIQTLPVIHRGRTSMFLFERMESLVDICAYVLMPNHFHLILREKRVAGISKFMQKLITAYTMYFNTQHERSGVLFQGGFKSTHADNDHYLKYLCSYVHLNPIKLIEPEWKEIGIVNRTKAEAFLDRYTYSSFCDYQGRDRVEKKILTMNALPNYFESRKNFDAHIADWLTYKDSIEVQPR